MKYVATNTEEQACSGDVWWAGACWEWKREELADENRGKDVRKYLEGVMARTELK